MKDYGNNGNALNSGIETYYNFQLISVWENKNKMLLPEPWHTVWQPFHIPENVLYIPF